MLETVATILIVDDNEINCLVFEALLKAEGYETVVALSGEAALAATGKKLPDLILLDVMMPDISGFDLVEKFKQDDRTRNIPVIMVTALDDRESRMAALRHGAEEFISKPVDRAELLIRVRNLLKLKKYHDFLADRSGIFEEQVAERTRELAAANSRLYETQEKLIQSDRLASIGQLAAGVAHEINNPIGYVHSNIGSLEAYLGDLFRILDAYACAEDVLAADLPLRAELLRIKAELGLDFLREDIPKLMAESKEGISRVRKIVQDLKDFSHVDSSQEWKLADLHAGLDSTLNVVTSEIKYKADVVKEYGALPEIECLPSQLNQVFLNLLVNAAQAMDDGRRGTITLRTGVAGGQVWVEIADNGSGIAPENLKRIFDPFFTTKPVGKGTGLGLSLSYGIVHKHGGRIEVSSELGKGSSFRVILSLRQSHEPKAGINAAP